MALLLQNGIALSQTNSPVSGDYRASSSPARWTLHLHGGASTANLCKIDSPDYKLSDLPCANFAVNGSKVSFSVPPVHASFVGEMSADHRVLSGVWDQGIPIPLTFMQSMPADAATLKPQLTAVDSMLTSEFTKSPIGSVTVGVVSERGLIWTRSYGFAEMAQHRPASEKTLYRIGSITKMFTGLMLEQLAEANKVHLSDPVQKYYPAINDVQGQVPGGSSITLIQLGLHTAGLSREPDDMWKFMQGPAAHWQDTLASALPRVHHIFEPGTRISYSNVGYAVLGAALAAAAGESYTGYVSAHIFAPLGMTHSSFDLNPAMRADLAQGYQVDGPGVDEKTPTLEVDGLGYSVPNGGAFSSVEDLARFCSFLMGFGPEGLLSPGSLDSYENRIPVVSNSALSMGTGLGYSVLRRKNYVAFGHNGLLPGYQAALYVNRDVGLGVIVLTNASGARVPSADSLAFRSLDLLSE